MKKRNGPSRGLLVLEMGLDDLIGPLWDRNIRSFVLTQDLNQSDFEYRGGMVSGRILVTKTPEKYDRVDMEELDFGVISIKDLNQNSTPTHIAGLISRGIEIFLLWSECCFILKLQDNGQHFLDDLDVNSKI